MSFRADKQKKKLFAMDKLNSIAFASRSLAITMNQMQYSHHKVI